jgi:hypothetical protein
MAGRRRYGRQEKGDISLLEVIVLRPDVGHWVVPVRTMRQAWKVARKWRWREGWPAFIHRHDEPADLQMIDAFRRWEERREMRRALRTWRPDASVVTH